MMLPLLCFFFFFFNDTATTEIYTLSLHDALPISAAATPSTPATSAGRSGSAAPSSAPRCRGTGRRTSRSEEHTSELQSHSDLVCRLLLEKKKKSTSSSQYTSDDSSLISCHKVAAP